MAAKIGSETRRQCIVQQFAMVDIFRYDIADVSGPVYRKKTK